MPPLKIDIRLLQEIQECRDWKFLHGHGKEGAARNHYYKEIYLDLFRLHYEWHNHPVVEGCSNLNQEARQVCMCLHKTLPEFLEDTNHVNDFNGNNLLKHLAKRDGYEDISEKFQEPRKNQTKVFSVNLQIAKYQLGKLSLDDQTASKEAATTHLARLRDTNKSVELELFLESSRALLDSMTPVPTPAPAPVAMPEPEPEPEIPAEAPKKRKYKTYGGKWRKATKK